MPTNPIEAIAYTGEQVLSFLDELSKLPCPRCGDQALTSTLVGLNIVVRCSEILQDYNSETGEAVGFVCDYIQVIKRTSITKEPFTLKVKEGRATSKNIPKPKPTPRRRKPAS